MTGKELLDKLVKLTKEELKLEVFMYTSEEDYEDTYYYYKSIGDVRVNLKQYEDRKVIIIEE